MLLKPFRKKIKSQIEADLRSGFSVILVVGHPVYEDIF
jgi:hypothetical protein